MSIKDNLAIIIEFQQAHEWMQGGYPEPFESLGAEDVGKLRPKAKAAKQHIISLIDQAVISWDELRAQYKELGGKYWTKINWRPAA